jgi:hypothetical protein
MLKLIRPGNPGQDPRPRPQQSRPRLTEAEGTRLRVVIKNLHRAYGTWKCLAEVMGLVPKALQAIAAGRFRGSYATAVFAARAAGLPVEEVLSGGIALAKNCPLCGAPHRGAQGQAQARSPRDAARRRRRARRHPA